MVVPHLRTERDVVFYIAMVVHICAQRERDVVSYIAMDVHICAHRERDVVFAILLWSFHI